MTVNEMLRRMSSEEFSEWQIIDKKFEPFGEWRKDIRTGMAMTPLINTVRGYLMGKLAHFVKPSDFILQWEKPSLQVQSMDQMKMVCKGLADAYKIAESRKVRVKTKK